MVRPGRRRDLGNSVHVRLAAPNRPGRSGCRSRDDGRRVWPADVGGDQCYLTSPRRRTNAAMDRRRNAHAFPGAGRLAAFWFCARLVRDWSGPFGGAFIWRNAGRTCPKNPGNKTHVVILGGGFAGVTTAINLEKEFR